jgi:hypothetical protein
MRWPFLPAFGLVLIISFFTQFTWKLEKDKDGIKVYTSGTPGSAYKSVRVECNMPGTYSKLFAILTDIDKFKDWIYHNKTSRIIKKISPYDFVYYSETNMPFPLSNRDVILHMKINTDSLPKFLLIQGKNEENVFPKLPSSVRVPHYAASWKVTMPSANLLHVEYILTVDPGGSIPAAIANNFVDRGPYETFKNLKELLK